MTQWNSQNLSVNSGVPRWIQSLLRGRVIGFTYQIEICVHRYNIFKITSYEYFAEETKDYDLLK